MDSALLETLDGTVWMFVVNNQNSTVRLQKGRKFLSISALKASIGEEAP